MERNKLIKTIYAGIKECGLKEAEYRALYKSATNKESLTQMTDAQLMRVIDALKKSGFQLASKSKNEGSPLSEKIWSLWLEIRDLGALRDPSEKALLNYIKGTTCGKNLYSASVRDLIPVVEQMKKWRDRIKIEKEATCQKN